MVCLQLPHRFYDQLVTYLNALHSAVTAGGTLPALPLPSLGMGSYEKRLPPAPPVPPTYWESLVKHVKSRPNTYSILGGISFTFASTMIAVHLSPAFRARLFHVAPLLKPIYIKRRRGLPPTPRPRLSSDGKHRLEAILVLGCEPGSYGREVAKAFERQGFIVIASVSSASEVDELEFCGKGFIKAIVLDSNEVSFPQHRSSNMFCADSLHVHVVSFIRNTALYQILEHSSIPPLSSKICRRSIPLHLNQRPRHPAYKRYQLSTARENRWTCTTTGGLAFRCTINFLRKYSNTPYAPSTVSSPNSSRFA